MPQYEFFCHACKGQRMARQPAVSPRGAADASGRRILHPTSVNHSPFEPLRLREIEGFKIPANVVLQQRNMGRPYPSMRSGVYKS